MMNESQLNSMIDFNLLITTTTPHSSTHLHPGNKLRHRLIKSKVMKPHLTATVKPIVTASYPVCMYIYIYIYINVKYPGPETANSMDSISQLVPVTLARSGI